TRVLIFSEKIGLQRASFSASSWLASSWVAVEHLAYPDPDRHGALDADRRVVRCRADHPRLAGPAVVGDGDVEIFAKRGHEGEAGRVVLERGLAAAGAARTPDRSPAFGAVVAFGGIRGLIRCQLHATVLAETLSQNTDVVRGVLKITAWADPAAGEVF